MSTAAATIFVEAMDRPFGVVSQDSAYIRIGSSIDGNVIALSAALSAEEKAAFLQELASQCEFLAVALRVGS